MPVRSLALAALALLAAAVQAQDYAVTGRVVDAETGAPVALASVALWRVSAREGVDPYLATGAATDAAGAFRIAGVGRGRYYVVVSFLGYATARVDSLRLSPQAPLADLGVIRLVPDAAALDAVEVMADRDRVAFEVDRTVYHIGDDPLTSGVSTSQALETIPSVEVDLDGNVSLRGNGNVVILVDGRPAPVGRDFVGVYLQSLPADAVERVEVIPNPSAAYEPDGSGGILNIVLKDDTELGLGGAVTLGGDSQGGYDATGLLTFGRGPLRLSGTAGLRQNERASDGDRFRINRFLDPETTLDQASADTRTRTSGLLNLSADYAATERTTLVASTQLGLRGGSSTETNETQSLLGDDVLDNYVRRSVGDGGGWSGDLRLGLRQDFQGRSQEAATESGRGRGPGGRGGRGGRGRGASVSLGEHALAVDLRLNASGDDDDETFTETGAPGTDRPLLEERTVQDGTDRSVSLQADYARPVGQTRVEVGLRSEAEARSSGFATDTLGAGGALVPDLGRTYAYDFDEQVHAAYVQLARQVGPVGLQAGLRGEVVRTTFTLGGEGVGNDYESLFPSAAATLTLTGSTVLRGSYSRRVNRPRGRQLNPFPTFDDPLNVRVGNPALRPEYTDAVELGVVQRAPWGTVTVTPFLRRTTDVIRRFQSVDGQGVTTSTYRNLDTSTSTGVEAVLAYQAGGPVRGFVSVEGFRQSTEGESVAAGLGADAFGWGGRLNGSVALGDRVGWGDLDLQSTVFYRAPMDTEQGRMGARLFFDIGLRQRLLDGRASLSVRARDPFGLAGLAFVQDDAVLYQEVSRSFGRQEVGLTFTYTFGETERRERTERAGAADEGMGDGGLEF